MGFIFREMRAGVVMMAGWTLCATVLAAILLQAQAASTAALGMCLCAAWLMRSRAAWVILLVALASTGLVQALQLAGG